jgi:acyl-CoA synthetase (AMP-forming)/AMP-acid ligase II
MQYLVHHMLQDSAARDPQQEALVDIDQRLDFGTAADQVAALASGLQSLGVQRGDRIAIFLKPSVALPIAILGASMAGAAFVPIHHGMFPEQVAHILNDSASVALITDGKRFEPLKEILQDTQSLKFAIVKEPSVDPAIQESVRVTRFERDAWSGGLHFATNLVVEARSAVFLDHDANLATCHRARTRGVETREALAAMH